MKMEEVMQENLMAAALSRKPIEINGERYAVEMEIEGTITRKDGTIEKITERRV